MLRFNSIYEYIRAETGCSQSRAKSAARRCYHDQGWAFQMLSIELYHRLYPDPVGEAAADHVMHEQWS